MAQAAKPTRANRTLTVDFHDETTYFGLLDNTKAFVECVLAFLLAIGFELNHKASCRGGRGLTRHSHYARVRLGGLTIWRVQCPTCKAVCSRSCRTSSYVTARCARTWPAMPCWPPMVVSVLHGVR